MSDDQARWQQLVAALAPLTLQAAAPFPVVAPGPGLSARPLSTVAVCPRLDLDLLRVSGPDRGRFLQGLLTADVLKLPVGEGAAAALLDIKGKMQFELRLYQRADDLLIEAPYGQAPALAALLDRYLIRMKAKLHEESAQWLGLLVAGPLTTDALRAVIGPTFEPPAALLSGCEATVADAPVSVTRTDWLGRAPDAPAAFHVWAQAPHWATVTRALLAAAAAHGGGPIPTAALEAARIEGGVPRFGTDTDTDTIPLEADLTHLLCFTKGCYLGQEIIARVDARGAVARHLIRARVRGDALPPAGAPVCSPADPTKRLGLVTSAAPTALGVLAFAWTRRGLDAPGTPLLLGDLPAEIL
jgi:aminomethyltransferase